MKINQRSRIHIATIFLIGISAFLLFSQIQVDSKNLQIQIKSGEKKFTELKYPFIQQIYIKLNCQDKGNGKIQIGSENNLENFTTIDLSAITCNKLTKVTFEESQLAEYIELKSDRISSIDINIKTQDSRNISNLRLFLLFGSILIYLATFKITSLEIKKDKYKFTNLIYFLPILLCSVVHFVYYIPNWDDGWQLARIRHWDSFGTANSLWDRFNGTFGNWLYFGLNKILSNSSNQFLVRFSPLVIWWLQYFILTRFIQKYFPSLFTRSNKLFLSSIYCLAVLSMGSSLRFESIIGLFNVIGLYLFYKYIKEEKINSLIGLLLISALSITTGLSGITTLTFPGLIIYVIIRNIKLRKIIYGQLALNSLLLTICLFMFNSNLKLFVSDINETRLMTIYSHNFGVLDEWRRYFGSDGIFNYYNFPLKLITVLIFIALYISIKSIAQKEKSGKHLHLIFILMFLSLSLTPSKWGWYILPIIPIASVIILSSTSRDIVIRRIMLVALSTYTLFELFNGNFWRSNPAINSQVINSVLGNNSEKRLYFLTLLIIILIMIFLLYLMIESFQTFLLPTVIFTIIFIQISGNSGLTSKNQSAGEEFERYSWGKNSLKSCSFVSKLKFTQIENIIEDRDIEINNAIFFPLDDEQFSKSGVKRLTFSENSSSDITIKVQNQRENLLFSFGVRGSEIDSIKVKTIYFNDNKRYESEVPILKSISDSSTWQFLEPFQVKSKEFEVLISRDQNTSDVQITEPFEVKKVDFLTHVSQNNLYFHLGPQELFLGSCLDSPQFSDLNWSRPDVVIGNANTLRNIFNTREILRVINTCWVPLDKATIDDCLVEWHFND